MNVFFCKIRSPCIILKQIRNILLLPTKKIHGGEILKKKAFKLSLQNLAIMFFSFPIPEISVSFYDYFSVPFWDPNVQIKNSGSALSCIFTMRTFIFVLVFWPSLPRFRGNRVILSLLPQNAAPYSVSVWLCSSSWKGPLSDGFQFKMFANNCNQFTAISKTKRVEDLRLNPEIIY